MFTYAKPAEVGVSSRQIKKYISILEKYGLSTHNVLMARHNKIFFEKYWEPFDDSFLHRMYSVTKSFVSIAIGFLIQEGKLSLNDKVIEFFPNDIDEDMHENVKNQTIKDMLMMSTGFVNSRGNWFLEKPYDRVKFYFEKSRNIYNDKEESKIPGTFFEYDSNGSFILGALVERISGKTLVDYLREKLFDKIGVSDAVECLKCPGGHSWSDSALLCKPTDLLKVAKFVMNYGNVNGEQILSEGYLREATSKMIDNSIDGAINTIGFGYGYQIWKTWNDSFLFNGMGCQFAICVPKKDMILVYNGDNQGNLLAKSIIIDRFFEEIVDEASDDMIVDDTEDNVALEEYCKNLKLRYLDGKTTSETINRINNVCYKMNKNPMKITEVKFTFNDNEVKMWYKNSQGEKTLTFGLGQNVFTHFPEEGYSDSIGTQFAPNNYYKCAASAAWIEDDKLGLMVQIIDKYFGRMYMSVSFKQKDKIAILCTKAAEDFLDEYQGYADGIKK